MPSVIQSATERSGTRSLLRGCTSIRLVWPRGERYFTAFPLMGVGCAGLNCAEIRSPVARNIGSSNPGKLSVDRRTIPCIANSSRCSGSRVRYPRSAITAGSMTDTPSSSWRCVELSGSRGRPSATRRSVSTGHVAHTRCPDRVGTLARARVTSSTSSHATTRTPLLVLTARGATGAFQVADGVGNDIEKSGGFTRQYEECGAYAHCSSKDRKRVRPMSVA